MATAGDIVTNAVSAYTDGVPPASAFPTHPKTWHYVCPEADLARGPKGRRLFGHDVVAFRTEQGNVAVIGARCSHLGANLACGKVAGETIQCPFHNWRFGPDGTCVEIPAEKKIPAFARQHSYASVIRHGVVYAFNGPVALFPLPFFADENPSDFVAAPAFSFTADASWLMVASQGFDTQHFESVHERRLLRPPRLERVSPFALRNRWEAEIVGVTFRDRLLRLLVGTTVALDIWNWGGGVIVVRAAFAHAYSRFLVFFRPLEDGRTHFDVQVFAPRGLAALTLPVRRLFTRGHLESEAAQVRGTEYQPSHLIGADAGMIECFRWLAAIPQTPCRPGINGEHPVQASACRRSTP